MATYSHLSLPDHYGHLLRHLFWGLLSHSIKIMEHFSLSTPLYYCLLPVSEDWHSLNDPSFLPYTLIGVSVFLHINFTFGF